MALRGRSPLQKIRPDLPGEFRKLHGVEKQAPARCAFLVGNLRMARVERPHHSAATSGASVTVDNIGFYSFSRIAGIDCCCRALLAKQLTFPDIKPDAPAVSTAIDLDAPELDRFHVLPAFRAAHRAGPILHSTRCSVSPSINRVEPH
jgi:hypothetical protein